jgi:hypothetical protein
MISTLLINPLTFLDRFKKKACLIVMDLLEHTHAAYLLGAWKCGGDIARGG